jgi:hypothetical protein
MNPYTTQNQELQKKEAALAGKREVQEKIPLQTEVVAQIVREDERKLEEKHTQQFETDLHRTKSKPVASAGSRLQMQPPASLPIVKSEFLLQIEDILADGLGDMYVKMEPSFRTRFKEKGEEVARKIEAGVAEGKVRVKLILEWIRLWLRTIPGVNKFFLEQEAKIKADKITSILA